MKNLPFCDIAFAILNSGKGKAENTFYQCGTNNQKVSVPEYGMWQLP